jgi:uncharacterized protein (TIGR01777 family)
MEMIAAAPMTVAVSGASGLVGSALTARLEAAGHTIKRLVRRAAQRPGEITWDPDRAAVDVDALRGLDAVIHLAGENIAKGRWTAEKKRRIRTSRVEGTRLLVDALTRLDAKPRVLVAASAIGYYGDRGGEKLDETAAPGDGFLAEVCRAWEAATTPAMDTGIRVVSARLGVVLAGNGGALGAILIPFKLGVGGPVGNGRQYMSWITIDDAARAFEFALTNERLSGPVNFVSPEPVTNAQFTKALGRVLRRPAVLPMPAFAARLALGQMADELLLASTRVVPSRLTDAGFPFEHPQIEPALRHVLGK